MIENEENIRQNIKENLYDLRVQTGLTQQDVAVIVEKSPKTVASWEQGISLPDPTTLYRLAMYYQKTMDYMYNKNK